MYWRNKNYISDIGNNEIYDEDGNDYEISNDVEEKISGIDL